MKWWKINAYRLLKYLEQCFVCCVVDCMFHSNSHRQFNRSWRWMINVHESAIKIIEKKDKREGRWKFVEYLDGSIINWINYLIANCICTVAGVQ